MDPSTQALSQQSSARPGCFSGAGADRLYHVTSLTLVSFQTQNSTHLFHSTSIYWAVAMCWELPWAPERRQRSGADVLSASQQGGGSGATPGAGPVEELPRAARTSLSLPSLSTAKQTAHAHRGAGSARPPLVIARSSVGRRIAQTPSPRSTCCSDSPMGPTALASQVHGPRCQLPTLGLQWPLV